MTKAIEIRHTKRGKFALCHLPKAFVTADHHQRFEPAFAVFVLKTNHEHGRDATRWLLVNDSHSTDRAVAERIFNKRAPLSEIAGN